MTVYTVTIQGEDDLPEYPLVFRSARGVARYLRRAGFRPDGPDRWLYLDPMDQGYETWATVDTTRAAA